MAIARAMGRSLRETVEYLGDENSPLGGRICDLPLGTGAREDLNAWKTASASYLAHNRQPPPFEMFDRTRAAAARLLPEESKRNLDRAAASWPGATRQK